MTFGIAGDSYDRFMGRYSRELAPRFVAFAGLGPGMRALDVGCGSGLLAAALAGRLGAANVAAADPSEPLLAACAGRVPGADVRRAPAEELPWADGSFDAVLSQLVLNFVFRSDHNGTVQGLVGAGVGAALVPRLTLEPHDESIVELDLGPRVPPRLIALAWHRDRYRTPAAHAFVDTAREVCAELQPETAAAA